MNAPARKEDFCPGCTLCPREGLPILLTRYAVDPVEDNPLPLGGSFTAPPISLEGTTARYTLHTLRAGFVYVYDEKHDLWQGYAVTSKGYLMEFGIYRETGPISPAFLREEVPCKPEKHASIARAVTLRDPENAGLFWIGFSDVEWTQDVWQRHKDSAYRARHMRKFDVAAWLENQKHPHACPIGENGQYLSDFAQNPKQNWAKLFAALGLPRTAPADKPYETNRTDNLTWAKHLNAQHEAGTREAHDKALRESKDPYTDKIIEDFARYSDKAVMLALDDPADITATLAGIITRRFNDFHAKQQRAHEHGLWVNNAIDAIQTNLQERAEEKLELALTYQGAQLPALAHHMIGDGDRFRLSADKIMAAREAAWVPYAPLYKESARTDFNNRIDAETAAFNEQTLIPLAVAHTEWIKSLALADYFICNFDERDIDSGEIYAQVVEMCVANTGNMGVCAAHYDNWLAGGVEDPQNLLLRAMVHNQQEEAEQIAALHAQLKVAEDKDVMTQLKIWKEFVKRFGKGTENAIAKNHDPLGRIIARLAGRIGAAIAQKRGSFSPGILASAVAADAPLVAVRFEGSVREFRVALARAILEMRGENARAPLRHKHLAKEMVKIFSENTTEEELRQHKVLVYLDHRALEAIPEEVLKGGVNNANGPVRGQALAASLRLVRADGKPTPDDLVDISTEQWRHRMAGHKSSVALGWASIVAAISIVNYQVAKEAAGYTRSARGKEAEMARKTDIALCGMIYGLGEAIEKAMLKFIKANPVVFQFRHPWRNGEKVSFKRTDFFKWGGKAFGVVGGLMTMASDYGHYSDAKGKGRTGLRILYGISTILGGVSIWVTLSSNPITATVGLVVILLYIGLHPIITEEQEEADLQDWLSEGYFGKKHWGHSQEMQKLREIRPDLWELAKKVED
jgi:hypothetical protein